MSLSSSSWCQGLASACDCSTPWTFHWSRNHLEISAWPNTIIFEPQLSRSKIDKFIKDFYI